MVKEGYEKGFVSKDEYAESLVAYQKMQEKTQTQSDARIEASIYYELR